jgi:hypothetical protein
LQLQLKKKDADQCFRSTFGLPVFQMNSNPDSDIKLPNLFPSLTSLNPLLNHFIVILLIFILSYKFVLWSHLPPVIWKDFTPSWSETLMLAIEIIEYHEFKYTMFRPLFFIIQILSNLNHHFHVLFKINKVFFKTWTFSVYLSWFRSRIPKSKRRLICDWILRLKLSVIYWMPQSTSVAPLFWPSSRITSIFKVCSHVWIFPLSNSVVEPHNFILLRLRGLFFVLCCFCSFRICNRLRFWYCLRLNKSPQITFSWEFAVNMNNLKFKLNVERFF